jgi:hypothetical protein
LAGKLDRDGNGENGPQQPAEHGRGAQQGGVSQRAPQPGNDAVAAGHDPGDPATERQQSDRYSDHGDQQPEQAC